MSSSSQPKIYGAIAAILKKLSVDKTGTLPSQLGGKPYITAVDLNAEIKRQFVENGIVMFPTEVETHKENIKHDNGKVTVTIVIEGRYQLVHIEDGSEVTIGGVGDGLAMGSAVASNIASTNALKNALLRTFLVTEQSTEDAAKEGTKDSDTAPRPATPPKSDASAALRTEIVGLLGKSEGDPTVRDDAKAFAESKGQTLPSGFATNVGFLTAWRDSLK